MPTLIKLKKPTNLNPRKHKLDGKKKRKISGVRSIQRLLERDIPEERLLRILTHPLVKTFTDGLTPKPDLSLTEWADKNRMLPQISAHEAGLWRTSRFPFLKRIQDLLSPNDPTKQVVVMKGAQIGMTEIGLNWMFYVIDYHPVPMLYVQKTLDNIGIFMDQRFDPALEEMPEVKGKIGTLKIGKNTGNTKRTKIFPGGMIRFGGANSASSLRSMPIAYLILDEEDSYEQDIQHEGSPSKLAIARTRNFPNKKVFRISTPTIKETSVIEPLYEEGTQEKYYVPCPHCGNYDHIRWNNIRKVKDEDGEPIPGEVSLLCESCGVLIEEHFKTEMLEKGKWVAKTPNAAYPSFHINSLYSPYGFYSWVEAMAEFDETLRKGDSALLKAFVNTVLGESWSETSKSIKATFLEKRKEDYKAQVPNDIVLLTSAWDTQDNRIEGGIIGWTRDHQAYWIDYREFMGSTESSEVWEQLDQYLLKMWRNEDGQSIPIAITGIDTGGHASKQVHQFCRLREHRNIFPIFGRPGWGKGYIARPKTRNQHGTMHYGIFVDEVKNKVYSQLQIEKRNDPGYWHFPDKACFDTQFFRMLTSENLVTKWYKGRNTLKWDLPEGKRNEALDVAAYNVGMLNILNPDLDALPVNQLFPVAFGNPVHRRQKYVKKKRKVLSKGFA